MDGENGFWSRSSAVSAQRPNLIPYDTTCGGVSTNLLKSIAAGFFAMGAVIFIFTIITLARGGDAWLAAVFPDPADSSVGHRLPLAYTKTWRRKDGCPAMVATFCLLCRAWHWHAGYYLATTFFVINISRLAYEINQLG
jgi:hypothetical protein